MENWKQVFKDKKIVIKSIISVILFIVVFIGYFKIIEKRVKADAFVSELESIASKNMESIFAIDKIYLCSSATAIDSSEKKNLGEMDIYQYTDIAIYIKNSTDGELTNKNTIKKLYIDNIKIEPENSSGIQNLVYTNLLKIGAKDELKAMLKNGKYEVGTENKRIDFNVLSSNKENALANYETATFYADCSNPISLKYINKLNKKYVMGDNASAMFDGTILEKAGIPIEDMNCKIIFKINLVNNKDEYYSCFVNLKLPLEGIYKGTAINSKTMKENEYTFFTF